MSTEELVTRGAFALYCAENAHRVEEFAKRANARAAIAADFDTFRNRYVRKFQDLHASLEAEGLVVTRAA